MKRITKSYRRIESIGHSEYIVQKSRFIGLGAPIKNEKEAQSFIDEAHKNHPDANHHVYAYIIGTNLDIQKFSDDGEPSGTAGRPILEIMKKEDLVNSVIIVSRYFGGIKLGGGGLIRAYAKSAKEVIAHNGVATMRLYQLINLEFEYQYWGKLENELRNHKIFRLESVDYDQNVHCKVYVPISNVKEAKKIFTDLTNGHGSFQKKVQQYLKEEE